MYQEPAPAQPATTCQCVAGDAMQGRKGRVLLSVVRWG